jgi:hypothetical protein
MAKARRDSKNVRRQLGRKMIREAKDKPCADCGVPYPAYVMQFDHRPGEEKKFNISVWVNVSQSLTTLVTEMSKCDVVCANCHAVRTHQRANGGFA